MTHSKALAKYASVFPDVLERPEKLLGPNYEAVFNCWSFFDTLTQEQKEELSKKGDFSPEFYGSKVFAAYRSTVGRTAVLSVYLGSHMTCAMISYEIIGMQVLLDQGHSLYFIKLLENL
jgi:hypothetical protein